MATYSIIIPAYNAALTLSACLDSILAQTESDWECLCVDDGSSDDTMEIIRNYESQDRRIRGFYQTHGGPSRARNHALAVASGEWVSFVDADDKVDPDYLSSFAAEPSKADINFTGIRFIWPDGENREYFLKKDCAEDPERIGALCERLVYNEIGRNLFGYSVNKFFRRELLLREGIRFPEGLNAGEDEVTALWACGLAAGINILPLVKYNYLLSENGLSSRAGESRELQVSHYREVLPKIGNPFVQRLCLARIYEELYREAVERNNAANIRAIAEFCQSCRERLPVGGRRRKLITFLSLFSIGGMALLKLYFLFQHREFVKLCEQRHLFWEKEAL